MDAYATARLKILINIFPNLFLFLCNDHTVHIAALYLFLTVLLKLLSSNNDYLSRFLTIIYFERLYQTFSLEI